MSTQLFSRPLYSIVLPMITPLRDRDSLDIAGQTRCNRPPWLALACSAVPRHLS